MNNTVDLIKDLRNKTGAGFLDCKNALSENNNNLEDSIEFLRKKGLAKASKKSTREAIEGAIGIYSNNKIIVLIKVNSETDFAAKSDIFLNFLDQLGEFAVENCNLNHSKEDFLSLKYKDTLIAEIFDSMIAKIGENLILNDFIILENKKSYHSFYIHNSYKKNIGKIISIIKYETNEDNEVTKKFSKNLCMHVAAMKPESLDINDLEKSFVEKEKNIQKELILNSGKPENIVEKILEGKMKKFYSEVTLLNQNYILDQDKTVKMAIQELPENLNFKINSFNIISL